MMAEKRIKIASIRIKNFRSIRNETITAKDFNIFVGLNDAGKSNVLKALNLFFTGETDYGKKFSFENDFSYLFPKTSHSTKEIRITIKFEIPDTYTDSGEYTWTKVWRTGSYFEESITNSEGKSPAPKSRVPSALRRIKYRYVPAVKSPEYYKTLLGDLYSAVFSSINNPLEQSVKSFSEALKKYTEELSSEVEKQLSLESILAFPDDLNEIFKALIFETCLNKDSIHVPLTARGDGIQARHIPIILRYIAHEDQKSRNKGSMKVCTVWGFEEPENGLELLKTFKLADEFEEYSDEIQMFVSTHSPAFYMKKESEKSNIFYVSKKLDSDETSISSGKGTHVIAENMGLMPLVAPFIEEQSKRLIIAEKIYHENILVDVPTILVEGETDIEYLKIAFAEHSPALHSMIEKKQLRIVCKNDGAGTTTLADWSLAWIYSGFKSKMLVLLDKDEAGVKAKNNIEKNEAFIHKQNAIAVRLQHIEPSDEIIMLLQKKIKFEFEIEHLLSFEFWKEIKSHGYEELRSTEEIGRMFNGLVPRDKTLDSIIDELVESTDVRDTILSFEPKSLKKKRILELLKGTDDKKSATVGLLRTVQKIESYFCGNQLTQ